MSSCNHCLGTGFRNKYINGISVGVEPCTLCNFGGFKKPSAELIDRYPSLFKVEQDASCGSCGYYNPHIGKCLNNDVMRQMRQANDWCINYEPKQETKQMKDYIVEKHEVKLDGTWYAVDPIVNTEGKIMFTDPRSATIPQPAAPCAPTPGAFKVTHLMISKNDTYSRTSRTMRVILNDDMDIVTKLKPNDAEATTAQGCFYATVILD